MFYLYPLVRITADAGAVFKGFMIAARTEPATTESLGLWSADVDVNVQAVPCHVDPEETLTNAVTHVLNDTKAEVSAVWTNPDAVDLTNVFFQ